MVNRIADVCYRLSQATLVAGLVVLVFCIVTQVDSDTSGPLLMGFALTFVTLSALAGGLYQKVFKEMD